MKLAQPNLFGEAPDELRLTERQRFVYDLVRTTPGGATSDEVGAALHERKGKHAADVRCRFCAEEGAAALRGKALAPLIVRRRPSGRWEPRNPADAHSPAEPHVSHQVPDDPFTGL